MTPATITLDAAILDTIERITELEEEMKAAKNDKENLRLREEARSYSCDVVNAIRRILAGGSR